MRDQRRLFKESTQIKGAQHVQVTDLIIYTYPFQSVYGSCCYISVGMFHDLPPSQAAYQILLHYSTISKVG